MATEICIRIGNRSKLSYDSLNWYKWVFAIMAREEIYIENKNAMLEYLGELMKNANNFS